MVNLLKMLSAIVVALACLTALTTAAEVEATLDRDSVPAGKGALLKLRITGGNAQRPVMPQVDNFVFQDGGQGREMRMINGRTSFAVTYTYVVGSETPGDYVIPPIELEVDGEKLATQPLKLKVLDSAAAQPPAGFEPEPDAEEPEQETGPDRFGFLTVELADNERKHAYVGEIAPVRIRAWLPEGAQAHLRSGIQPEAKGFTLHNVSDRPQQSVQEKDGKRYTVVTWFGGISATKAGNLPASLSVDATVAVRDTSAPRHRRPRGDAFDDPFFDSIFDRMHQPMVQKDVTLKSEDQEIEVRPLPVEGRPENFGGAVGEFAFDAVEIPSKWTTGEPQQIGARISGSGNFALLKAPDIARADGWKTYPAKEEFAAGDNTSFSGNKTFRFSAVQRQGGERQAALTFSYFDPTAGAYKTITSSAQAIEVAGEDMAETEPEAAPVTEPVKKDGPRLVGQREEMSPRRSLVPLVERAVFGQILGSAAGLGLLGCVLAFARSRRDDPSRREVMAREKATREALAAARAAKDAAGFFAAARLAVQQRLAAMWNQPPQAITLAEVEARVPGDSPVVEFFREADRHEYGSRAAGEIAPQWRALLDEAMASLVPVKTLT